MTSLWSPRYPSDSGFSSLFRMLDDFDRYTRDVTNTANTALRSFHPKFDVSEHESHYFLQGELPGVPPEDVVIEFTDPQTLVIRGNVERVRTEGDPSLARIEHGEEVKRIEGKEEDKKEGEMSVEKKDREKENATEKGKKQPKYWLSERSFGEFSRVFSFANAVDQDKVEAKFEHGVLNVVVPKAVKKGTRRIEIK
jgi:HSP20 family molecular chaperone IbpA